MIIFRRILKILVDGIGFESWKCWYFYLVGEKGIVYDQMNRFAMALVRARAVHHEEGTEDFLCAKLEYR
jgi:hypothetical protein